MSFLKDPFFWAFLSMFAVLGTSQIVGNKRLGKHPALGMATVAFFALGRVVLVLPAVPQPRFNMGPWHWILGAIVFASGIALAISASSIRPFTVSNEQTVLKTDGPYHVVRNPIYLAELLWCLGWSTLFQSVIGILLVPFWWISLLCITMIEEEKLAQVLGRPYLEYKRRVRGRILPGLPL